MVDSHVSIPEAQVRSIANHVRPDRQSKHVIIFVADDLPQDYACIIFIVCAK